VPPRLSATERIRAQIDELFASQQDLGQILEQVARLSVRLVIQAAWRPRSASSWAGERYARGERERAGYRNGHAELTVKTTAGPVVLERPKLRGTSQPFASRLLGKGVSRTNALEALVISGFVRGLSTHDVEAAPGEVVGPEAALSKSTVNRICQAIKDEFDAWKTRDLGGIELEYLFLDGSHFRMQPGAPAEPGQLAVDEARRRAEAFADRYGKRYPAAVACLLDSLPELTTFPRFPRVSTGKGSATPT
jgi:putative transposase